MQWCHFPICKLQLLVTCPFILTTTVQYEMQWKPPLVSLLEDYVQVMYVLIGKTGRVIECRNFKQKSKTTAMWVDTVGCVNILKQGWGTFFLWKFEGQFRQSKYHSQAVFHMQDPSEGQGVKPTFSIHKYVDICGTSIHLTVCLKCMRYAGLNTPQIPVWLFVFNLVLRTSFYEKLGQKYHLWRNFSFSPQIRLESYLLFQFSTHPSKGKGLLNPEAHLHQGNLLQLPQPPCLNPCLNSQRSHQNVFLWVSFWRLG